MFCKLKRLVSITTISKNDGVKVGRFAAKKESELR